MDLEKRRARRRRKRRRERERRAASWLGCKRRWDAKPESRAKLRLRSKRWRAAHPEANRAHDAVRYAIRVGRLSRGCCAECGEGRVEAHHEDYGKPLEVIWLCARHHRLRHMEMG